MSGTARVTGEAGIDTTRINILIVDDEPANLLVLETVLNDASYRLVRANSADEALMALLANDFAVLVLDIQMPGLSGFELAHMIKERKRTAHIPIIFLTAYYSEDQHILAGYGSGAVDFLHKPVNPVILRAKVAVFADLHRKSLALEAANRALQAEVVERRRAEARLTELNESLDRRVVERTTELHASEAQLREANRRKDEFLATLAHELRNPLAPMRNAVYLLRAGSPDAERLDRCCDLIDRQVRSMARLIDDLMDVGRVNQGRIELRLHPVALAAVLQDAIGTIRPLVDECGHELALALPEAPLFVLADGMRLAQAFTNLLNNAAKYMDKGGVIHLDVRAEAGDAVVSVRDRGIGIAPDRLEGVFEMFSQVETALSRSRGGLGIGLALTRRLVELHGGTVSARSDGLGAGSEFVVRLPLVEPPDEVAVDEPRQATPPPEVIDGIRVLVADDNVEAGVTTTLLLEEVGHTVRRVEDGSAAVAAAEEFRPHVALLDVGMPRLNGYEACSRIRLHEHGKAMTIVAVTGWGQPADVRLARDAGFDHHLVKPVEPAALLAVVARHAEQGRQPPASDREGA